MSRPPMLRIILTPILVGCSLLSSSGNAQVTEILSVNEQGEPGNGGSGPLVPGHVGSIAFSVDGKKIVFLSTADNLVEGDANQSVDAFFLDRVTGELRIISLANNGSQDRREVLSVTISGDGKLAAMVVRTGDYFRENLIRLHELETRRTRNFEYGVSPSLSEDGSVIAYATDPYAITAASQIHIFDARTSETTRIPNFGGGAGNLDSQSPYVTLDGCLVAFSSKATNFVRVADNNRADDIFLYDRESQIVEAVSVSPVAGLLADGASTRPAVSQGGRFVAFRSFGTDLVTGDTNGVPDIFVRDRQLSTTRRVSVSSDGTPGTRSCNYPSISQDGSRIAFVSSSRNLVPGKTSRFEDAFVHDMNTGETTWASLSQMNQEGDGSTVMARISGEGNALLFSSDAERLSPGDENGLRDLFLRRLDDIALDIKLETTILEVGQELALEAVLSNSLATERVVDRWIELVPPAPAIPILVQPPLATVLGPFEFRSQQERLPIPLEILSGPRPVRLRLSAGAYPEVENSTSLRIELPPCSLSGTVNAGRGSVERVLRLNGSAGGQRHEVSYNVLESFAITMKKPSSVAVGDTARFALYLWPLRTELPEGAGELPFELGCTFMPMPLTGGTPQPAIIWNNTRRRGGLGASTHPSIPAPSVVFRKPNGLTRFGAFFIQGIIYDPGSAAQVPASATNGIIARPVVP